MGKTNNAQLSKNIKTYKLTNLKTYPLVPFVRFSITAHLIPYRKFRGIKIREYRGCQILFPKKKDLRHEVNLFCTRTNFFFCVHKKITYFRRF